MVTLYDRRDGWYDEDGRWHQGKHCFIPCGEHCTCAPPNGEWIKPGSKADNELREMVKQHGSDT